MKKLFYIFLACFLLVLVSLPKDFTSRLKSYAIAFVVPMWQGVASNLEKIEEREEINRLRLENELLRSEVGGVYEWLLFHQRIEDEVEQLKKLSLEKREDLYWREFAQRRSEELKNILERQLQALPAKVVFRSPFSWGNSIWINVGEKNNEALGKLIIAKNSPVVVGEVLVGIVEHVGENFSEVRLISDSSLNSAVRAVRGKKQDGATLEQLKAFVDQMHLREDIFTSKKESEQLFSMLSQIHKRLLKKREDAYLAKGEICGASHPLWRLNGNYLKGRGFNYNTDDDEGKGRDLITGHSEDDKTNGAIIQEGDLLVTTGLDGVFPAGLLVANVTKVFPLKEGDYAYEIEAKSLAFLDNLKVVFVLPPSGFERY